MKKAGDCIPFAIPGKQIKLGLFPWIWVLPNVAISFRFVRKSIQAISLSSPVGKCDGEKEDKCNWHPKHEIW